MSHYGASSYGPSRGSGATSSNPSYRYSPYSSGGGPSSSRYGSSSHSNYHAQSSSNLRSYDRGYGNSSSSGGSRGYHSSSSSSLMNMNGNRGRNGGRGGRTPRGEFGIPFGQAGAGLSTVDWNRIQLQPFQKNFYREAESVSSMTEDEVEAWRNERKMNVIGKAIPRPIRTFEEAGFPEYIMAEIRRVGFKAPTSIQSQGWPMAMSGRDLVGIAQTGSGKTLAFLLPAIVHINAQPLLRAGDGPIVLTIAPTRELAVQIEGEARKFAYSCKIKHTCVYGGVSRRDQARQLKEGVEVIICTPGRLLDFLESGTTNLRRVTYCVIDEADRLLDMGFEPQLKAIMSQIRPDKQILMWSATWPEEVRSLAHEFLKGEIMQVAIGSFDVTANADVTQVIEVMQQYDKQGRLFTLLREYLSKTTVERPTKILVFTATKRTCDNLTRMLKTDKWPATSIHGDKQQYERDQALADFKQGKCPIMLATDVASRGIHVDDITVVINYDMPGNIEDYVHRIGRTGRCGKKGIAISFFTRDDGKRATKLVKILRKVNQPIPDALQQIALENSMSSGKGKGRRNQSQSNRSHSNSMYSQSGSSSSSSSNNYSKYRSQNNPPPMQQPQSQSQSQSQQQPSQTNNIQPQSINNNQQPNTSNIPNNTSNTTGTMNNGSGPMHGGPYPYPPYATYPYPGYAAPPPYGAPQAYPPQYSGYQQGHPPTNGTMQSAAAPANPTVAQPVTQGSNTNGTTTNGN